MDVFCFPLLPNDIDNSNVYILCQSLIHEAECKYAILLAYSWYQLFDNSSKAGQWDVWAAVIDWGNSLTLSILSGLKLMKKLSGIRQIKNNFKDQSRWLCALDWQKHNFCIASTWVGMKLQTGVFVIWNSIWRTSVLIYQKVKVMKMYVWSLGVVTAGTRDILISSPTLLEEAERNHSAHIWL